jgi:phage FluMu protein Com
MTNGEKFKEIFNLYATEVWAKPEEEFLEWANSNYKEISNNFKQFKCDKCGHEYLAEAEPQWDEFYCFTYWESNCPKCNNLNEINDCYWR